MNWYYLENGKVVGPVTKGSLLELLKARIISKDDLICPEGEENWVPLVTVFPNEILSENPASRKVPLGKRQKAGLVVASTLTALFCLVIWLSKQANTEDEGGDAYNFLDSNWATRTFEEAIDSGGLQMRTISGQQLAFLPNSDEPFTGWSKESIQSTQTKTLHHLKDGIKHGGWAEYYENGQVCRKGTYSLGKKKGLQESWYENGQKSSEILFNEKVVSVLVWKPSGEKCPQTRVENGNGKAMFYRPDGTVSMEGTYVQGAGTTRFIEENDSLRTPNLSLKNYHRKNSSSRARRVRNEVRSALLNQYGRQPELLNEVEEAVMKLHDLYPELSGSQLILKFRQITGY